LAISNYSELRDWCDFIFEVLEDDERHVDVERQKLTFRYDLGVNYRLERERKERSTEQDPWVADLTYHFMQAVSRAQPLVVDPDDEWLLTIWSSLANRRQSIREAAAGRASNADYPVRRA
jgi:hypothetical protein